MEIDFLGLNSKHSNKHRIEEQSFKDPSDNGGDEIFLSLSSTGYAPNSYRQILDSPETWKFPFNKMIRACSSSSNSTLAYYNQENARAMEQSCLALSSKPLGNHHPSTTASLLYDSNKMSPNLRGVSEVPEQQAPLAILYSGSSYVRSDNLPEKGNNTMYNAGNTFTRAGYTPTVAMARTATLARFLEKRSHRLNQARTSHSIGKSLNANNFEARNLSIIRCNKKISNSRSGCEKVLQKYSMDTEATSTEWSARHLPHCFNTNSMSLKKTDSC